MGFQAGCRTQLNPEAQTCVIGWARSYNRSMRPIVIALCLLGPSYGAVTGMEILKREDAPGRYERIRAKAHFTLDPKLPANRLIRDLEFAPRNEQGMVEFSADVEVLKPRDPANGNGTLLLDVVNRGGQTTGMFTEEFLIARGFTMAWVGWQWDVPKNPEKLRFYPAYAKGVEGIVRAEFTVHEATTVMNLADRDHQAYPVANAKDLELTVREGPLGRRTTVPTAQWKLNGTQIEMPGGFKVGQTYELVYPSRDPAIAGLGMVAIRDVVSFLKFGGPGHVLLADQQKYLKRAIGYGASQSGRFLRTFLYQGINADEKGKVVFDGVWANVAGAGRGSFNHRFAQASRDGHPTMNFLYPTDLFPFSDLPQKDELSGETAGLLPDPANAPRIFYTNGSYEYWGRAAALIHTTPDGKIDAPLAENTRIYFVAGSQHGPQRFPPAKVEGATNLANSNDYRPLFRAFLVAMHEWLKDGTAPPDSNYPRRDQGQLLSAGNWSFPKSVSTAVPSKSTSGQRLDFGPDFAAKGIVTKEPPTVGEPFPALVPQVDDDGNEIAGIKMPQVAMPLASYTGWNLRRDVFTSETYNMVGSTIPFPKAKIVEKYGTREEYLGKAKAAIRDMVQRRLLLASEVEQLEKNAATQWDWFLAH